MTVEPIKIIKAQERENSLAPEKESAILRIERLRVKLQDARRRLNTLDEILEEACEMLMKI